MTTEKQTTEIFNLSFLELFKDEDSLGKEVNVGISVKHIKDGLLKDISGNDLKVLLTIISYSNKEGVSYPSQKTIADKIGINRATVGKAINRLTEVEIDGKPIIEKTNKHKGVKTKYFLQVNHFSLLNTSTGIEDIENTDTTEYELDDGGEEQEEEEFTLEKAPDFIKYFMERYEEHYGVAYMPNWGRDGKNVKEKLIGKYDPETLKAVVDYTVENYGDKWANEDYPRPTIGMLYTWLFNKVLGELDKEQKQKEQQQKDFKEQREDDETEIALDLF